MKAVDITRGMHVIHRVHGRNRVGTVSHVIAEKHSNKLQIWLAPQNYRTHILHVTKTQEIEVHE